MARYEFVEGSSSKFWEIDRKGNVVTTKWGRLGSDGQSKVEKFPSEEKAKAAVEKQTASKVKKGYAVAGGKGAAKKKSAPVKKAVKKAGDGEKGAVETPASDDGFMRFELVEGTSSKFWAIKRDDKTVTTRFGKIGTAGTEKVKTHEYRWHAQTEIIKGITEKLGKGYTLLFDGVRASRNEELERSVADAIDDPQAFEVYADFLQTKGDPRGELVSIDVALAKGKSAKLSKARSAWVEKYPSYYQPPAFRTLVEEKPGDKKGSWRYERENKRINRLDFANGFIRSARISTGLDGHQSLVELTLALLTHPAARFLHTLEYGPMPEEHDYTRVVGSLLEIGAPALRSLWLADFRMEDSELSWSSLGDLSGLGEALPRLERLKLRTGSMKLGKIELPNLSSFTVETGGLSKESVKSIATARWPKLEHLEIWFGREEYGAGGTVEAIRPILEGKGLPKLKTLALKNAEFTDEICAVLPASKIVKQLEKLDLSMGTMSDEGAKAIADSAKSMQHLELDVSDNYLGAEGKNALGKHFKKLNTKGQKEIEDWADGERFTSVGE